MFHISDLDRKRGESRGNRSPRYLGSPANNESSRRHPEILLEQLCIPRIGDGEEEEEEGACVATAASVSRAARVWNRFGNVFETTKHNEGTKPSEFRRRMKGQKVGISRRSVERGSILRRNSSSVKIVYNIYIYKCEWVN